MSKKNAEYLKFVEEYKANLDRAKSLVVAVGLPAEQVGGKVYGDGWTVLENGLVHEFGVPEKNIPSRSFLRIPMTKNAEQLKKFIAKRFNDVLEKGEDAFNMISQVGAKAQSIILLAFKTEGDGEWRDLKAKTIKRKGSSGILTDSGTLKQSITYIVRKK